MHNRTPVVRPRRQPPRPLCEAVEPRLLLSSTLIPVTDHRDLVYDATRNQLLITTSAGKLQRYDLATGTLLAPYDVGVSLNGADITPDGEYAYVADRWTSLFYRVRLSDGQTTALSHAPGWMEGVTWDVKIGPNGQALTTSRATMSPETVTLRKLDLATGVFSDVRTIDGATDLFRTPDRTSFLVAGGWGSVFWYDAAHDTYTDPVNLGHISGINPADYAIMAAVSPDGQQVAMNLTNLQILGTDLRGQRAFEGLVGGVAYDPTKPVLYAVDSRTDQLVAIDTTTWTERYRLDIGEDVGSGYDFGNGEMRVTPDGKTLFLATPSGVRVFALPQPTGVPERIDVGGYPTYLTPGYTAPLTVSVRDSFGTVLTGYRGTVHFTSSDPSAVLPADYTFTAADGGIHTFDVSLGSVGTQSITATDVTVPGVGGSQAGIVVHDRHYADDVAIHGPWATVYDPGRHLIYTATDHGTIERYDPAGQALLPPIRVGTLLSGMDITPDGRFLYVSDYYGYKRRTVIHKVDLDTGAVKDLLVDFDIDQIVSAPASLVITSDGKALFAGSFSGSATLPLRQIDLATDTISDVIDVNSLWGDAPLELAEGRLTRSADRSTVFIQNPNSQTDGPVLVYDAVNHRISARRDAHSANQQQSAISADGKFAVVQVAQVLDPHLVAGLVYDTATLSTVAILPDAYGGMAFDPVTGMLYVGDHGTDEIWVYDPRTWQRVASVPIGEPLIQPRMTLLSVSDDGKYLLVSTRDVAKVVPLPLVETPPYQSDAGGPYYVDEGGAVTLTATSNLGPGTVYEWDTHYNGADFVKTDEGQSIDHPTDSWWPVGGPYTVAMRATGPHGVWYDYTDVYVRNLVPTASLNPSSTTVVEGGSASLSFGPPAGGWPTRRETSSAVLYSYDFDGDGVYDINSPTESLVQIPARFLADGPSTLTVTGIMSDEQGGPYNVYHTTITVTNAAPSATFADVTAVAGQPARLVLTNVSDPSADDMIVGMRYSFDLDNDGTFEVSDTVPWAWGTFASAGVYTVRARVEDKDGGSATYVATVTVQAGPVPPAATPSAYFSAPLAVAETTPAVVGFADASGVGPFTYSFDFDNDGLFEEPGSPDPYTTVPSAYFWDGPATRTVHARITDSLGRSTDYRADVKVLNAPPAADSYDFDAVAGQPVVIGVNHIRDGADVVIEPYETAYFDLDGDGIFDNIGMDPDPIHPLSVGQTVVTFPTPGDWPVTVQVMDKDGDWATYRETVHVVAPKPTAWVFVSTAYEGSVTLVRATGVTGFGPFTYQFDLDNDGTFETDTGGVPYAIFGLQHTADNKGGAPRVGLRVTDGVGQHVDVTNFYGVNGVPPTADFTISPTGRVNAGSPLTASFAFPSDPSAADVAAGFRYSYDLDGDGVFEIAGSPSPTATVPAAGSGVITIRGRIADKDGQYTDYTRYVEVNPRPYATSFRTDGPAAEGPDRHAHVSFVGAIDPADFVGVIKYSYDFDNDGVFEITDSSLSTVDVPAQYLVDGPTAVTIRGRVTDRYGAYNEYTTTLSVTNVAPTFVVTQTGDAPIYAGDRVELVLQAEDPGQDQISSLHVNWGDGSAVDQTAYVFGHSYATAGTYTVTITATDEDGAYSVTRTVSVAPAAIDPPDDSSGGSSGSGGSPDLPGEPVLAPTATLLPGAAPRPDRSAYRFSVTYADDQGMNAGTVGDDDLVVSGNGWSLPVRLVSVTPTSDGHGLVATYDVAGHFGTWTWQDNGTYSVSVLPGHVLDSDGLSVQGGSIGSFAVSLAAPEGPDLQAAFAGAAPKAIAPGSRYTVRARVTNKGRLALPSTAVATRLYLSKDNVLDGGDSIVATSSSRLALRPNGSRPVTFKFNAPMVDASGNYYLLVEVDSARKVGERDERNNVAASRPVAVSAPHVDLAPAFRSALRPTYKAGELLRTGIRITNVGNATGAGSAVLSLYFSSDGSVDVSDPLLWSITVPLARLKAGAAKTVAASFKVPASLAGRSGYLVAKVSMAQAGDHNPANDVARSRRIAVR